MNKKIYVVTGANQGIGLETARSLAAQGAKVLLITRSEEKGNAAIANILASNPEADLEHYLADMSLLEDIRNAGKLITEKHPVIDGLINNVGTWMSDFILTREGIETVFATNHLSYFLMTHMLYPSLRKAEHGRIVNVASNAHSYGKINIDDPGYSKNYHGLKSNGQSKLANIYFTFELSTQMPDANVTTYAASPGLVKTDIGLKHTSWLHTVAWKFRRRKGQTPAEGARTSVFCATDPSVQHISGKYWESCQVKEVFKSAQNPELGKQLWELSMRMCGIDNYFM
ncbi:MAG: SDR family oxidoreductase [Saprospiraceae bacterium]|nr:SDR family oxidoreductase [Saprospiraceae bacterium]